jgi:hypothetical protein
LDEDFFFPQNVRTSYRLWVFGPKHLRRIGAGLPVIVLGAAYLGRTLSLPMAAAFVACCAAVYIAAWCWPLFTDEQTVLDLLLHLHRRRRQQTAFPYDEEVPF